MRSKANSRAAASPGTAEGEDHAGTGRVNRSGSKRGMAPKPDRANGSAAGTIFGYRFQKPKLLELALTHRSMAYEAGAQPIVAAENNGKAALQGSSPQSDNEQFEFLGDAVLGFVVAEDLFRRFPGSREGELTRLRASIVSRRHLGEVASRLRLGEHLRLGKGEERTGGRNKPALLSNTMEAVIAAMYLDGGLSLVAGFIEREIVAPALPALHAALVPQDGASSSLNGAVGDHKSALQERLQAAGYKQPHYVLVDQSGPDHQKQFSIEVRVVDPHGEERPLGQATGATKKVAQQEAARLALVRLDAEGVGVASAGASAISTAASSLNDASDRNGHG